MRDDLIMMMTCKILELGRSRLAFSASTFSWPSRASRAHHSFMARLNEQEIS
jgi:hypothetical protein